MRKKVVPLELSDGSFVYVEVEDVSEALEDDSRGTQLASRNQDKEKQSFEAAIKTIKPAVNALMQSLKDINEPDEICLDVGVKLTQQVGAILASTSGDVTFKVSLKWKKAEDV